jgi:cell division protein ZapB
MTMSLEVFEKLESKVQQAIDTITLLQMEIEELKEKNNTLVQEVQSAQHGREELEREQPAERAAAGLAGTSAGAAGSHGRSLIASRPLPPGRGSSLLASLYPQVIANLFLFFNH